MGLSVVLSTRSLTCRSRMSCTAATGTPGSLEVRSAIEILDNKFRRAKGMLPWENVGWKEQFSSLPTMHVSRVRKLS